MKKYISKLTDREVIHAPTLEISEALCKKFHELGLKWIDSSSYLINQRWKNYNEKMCYCPKDGTYSGIDYFKSNDYIIYNITDILDFQCVLESSPQLEKYFRDINSIFDGDSKIGIYYQNSNKEWTCISKTNMKSNQLVIPFDIYFNNSLNINNMKTTREKLLSIYNKGNCNEFKDVITNLIKDNFDKKDSEEFEIPTAYLEKIPRCNSQQKELLQSIGIVNEVKKWSRDSKTDKKYYYIERTKGFFGVQNNIRGYYPLINTFESQELAEKEVKIYNLMMAMRNWARFHNQLDGFTPEWGGYIANYGININNGKENAECMINSNSFIFQIVVSSRGRAKEMLEEFRTEIQEVIPYL